MAAEGKYNSHLLWRMLVFISAVWFMTDVIEAGIANSNRDITNASGEVCKNFMRKTCPLPEAPQNGGLLCVSINNTHYCKPMCNQGYDFAFLRRSRIYETCGASTGYSWTTQLVGGNRLAVCFMSPIAISGVKSAYFPTGMSCQETIANAIAERQQIELFLKELAEAEKDVVQKHNVIFMCILCGDRWSMSNDKPTFAPYQLSNLELKEDQMRSFRTLSFSYHKFSVGKTSSEITIRKSYSEWEVLKHTECPNYRIRWSLNNHVLFPIGY